tara:strand:+ start:2390 stop:2593 length:204 start_codon:yes stop_codon:yes gene_type:complete
MNNSYRIEEILEAVESILDQNNKVKKSKEVLEKPLILNDSIKTPKKKLEIPRDTEKIILQAEKYLKK